MPIQTMHLQIACIYTKYIILYIYMYTRGARVQNNTLCISMWCQYKRCTFSTHAHILNISFCIFTYIPEVHVYKIMHVEYSCDTHEYSCDPHTNDAPPVRMHIYQIHHFVYIHVYQRCTYTKWYMLYIHVTRIRMMCLQYAYEYTRKVSCCSCAGVPHVSVILFVCRYITCIILCMCMHTRGTGAHIQMTHCVYSRCTYTPWHIVYILGAHIHMTHCVYSRCTYTNDTLCIF